LKQNTLVNIADATTANGYGTRYVQSGSPSGTLVAGDIWYEI